MTDEIQQTEVEQTEVEQTEIEQTEVDATAQTEPVWLAVGTEAELTKAKKTVVVLDDGRQVLVLPHDGGFVAFDNICIHRDRELHKGVILNGKLVCPGHQWAFALGTGWEAVKEQCQPTYRVEVIDGTVHVDTASRAARAGC